MVVWWLRLHASKAEGLGSIPGRRTNILHAYVMAKNLEKKKYEKVIKKKKDCSRYLKKGVGESFLLNFATKSWELC